MNEDIIVHSEFTGVLYYFHIFFIIKQYRLFLSYSVIIYKGKDK